ncbi:hypothetical protein, partial [Pseudomonas sp. GW456-12-1-14-LB2]|uniref:hypothetical protein n=1 Tax=Pseudomonas sp. GW456-12-1-14-LB2 TaxID=2070606 RepID=UPI001C4782FD
VANGCAGTVFTLSVPVKPVPVIGNIVDTICSGYSFLVNLSNLPSNTVYSWTNPVSYPFGAIIGGSAQPAFVNAISQNLTNST